MINRRSDYLVVLLATYNRLESLQRSIRSIEIGTRCSHEIIAIDGGSTDGTIEWLQTQSHITSVFQNKLIGQVRACNQVWRQVECKFTCWLNDDTELVPGSLDKATHLLEARPDVGMVGLKMKDVDSSLKTKSYSGGISEYGILNCNHGVLPMQLLREIGYFDERYHTYGLDPDLTASVLCAGKKVIFTKQIGVLHYRSGQTARSKIEEYKKIYRKKFDFLGEIPGQYQLRIKLFRWYLKNLFRGAKPKSTRFGLDKRDREILSTGMFFGWKEPFAKMRKDFHLEQKIPAKMITTDTNPYKHLVSKSCYETEMC